MILKRIFVLVMFSTIFLSTNAWAENDKTLSITGEVRQPLNLSLGGLDKLKSASARLNEAAKDGGFHGVFWCEGPSLKSVLELAGIQKEDSDFSKPIDLAIVARNSRGEQVALSWGEVFYWNPAEIILATKVTPVMPHRACDGCHTPDIYEPRFNQLKRSVALPKLVIANDFYTDRCIEDITNIEVVNLHLQIPSNKKSPLFSPGFVVSGKVGKEISLENLSSAPHRQVVAKQTGDGKGYHGLKSFGGVSLKQVLDQAAIAGTPDTVIVVSSPDGYRSLLSYGELYFARSADDVILADSIDGKPLKEDGKFYMIVPDDLAADRWVKAVERIEVIQLARTPKLYVIGAGCGNTNLITLEAISYLAKADVLVAPEDIRTRFSKYFGNKPALFDPIESLEKFMHKADPNISFEERKRLLNEQRTKEAHKVAEALKEGKSVAYLDYGDPMIYGSWRFLQDQIETDKMVFIPGISSFNAANSLIARDITCNGSVVITEPHDLAAKELMIQSIAKSGDTLGVFMGLKELKNLMPLFEKYYPKTVPVALVYEAGYSGKERVIRTTLEKTLEVAEKEKEKWLGLIYIGACLNDAD